MVLMDGAHHAVDSSEMAFRLASIGAVKQGQSQLYKMVRWLLTLCMVACSVS